MYKHRETSLTSWTMSVTLADFLALEYVFLQPKYGENLQTDLHNKQVAKEAPLAIFNYLL